MTDAELDQCRHDGALLRSIVSDRVKLKKKGNVWKGCCPFHPDDDPSFTVYPDGHYHCFGCNAHGSVFDFVMATERLDFPAAVRRVEAEKGLAAPKTRKPTSNGKHKDEMWRPIIPPPANVPPPGGLLKDCTPFEYVGPDGRLQFYQRRVEGEKGKRKQFYPLTYGTLDGAAGWHSKGPPQPYPLYRLDRLSTADPDSFVMVVEGEGKCQSAERLFPDFVCTSWMGGANAVDKSDWSVLRRFREERILYWADADRPMDDGKAYGCFIATPAFRKLFPRAKWIDTAGLETIKDGYDAADLEDGRCDDPDAWLKERLREPEATEEYSSSPDSRAEHSFFVPDDHELPQIWPILHRASDWSDRIVPAMRWVVEDWIPRRQVTGLYGVGGSLKTWLLVQTLMARAAGLVVLGQRLEPEPTLGLFCEDTAEEIVRRKEKIARFYGRPLADFHDFHWVSLVGVENTELVTFDSQNMQRSQLLRWLDYTIKRLGISLVGLDTLAHMFGGEEIRRREVARFIRQLDAISITRDCALLFTAQPSVRGKATGTMESGSTHWEAGVRSRLTWQDPSTEENSTESADPNVIRRVLTRVKSNYAEPGGTMELIWRDRLAFIPAAVDAESAKLRQRGPGHSGACEDRFLELLAKVHAQGDYVHNTATHPSHFAPVVFAKRPDGRPFTARDYGNAMTRLFAAKRLRMEEFGPPSRGKRRLRKEQP